MVFYSSARTVSQWPSIAPRIVSSIVFGAVALGIAFFQSPLAARADTSAQAQQAIQALCNHTATSFDRQDLTGYLKIYAPNFTSRSVAGHRENFLHLQARIAAIFSHGGYSATTHGTVSQLVLQGSQAQAVLHWHYLSHYSRSSTAPGFTIVRDYEEQSVWKKSAVGWRETSSDMTHDVQEFRR